MVSGQTAGFCTGISCMTMPPMPTGSALKRNMERNRLTSGLNTGMHYISRGNTKRLSNGLPNEILFSASSFHSLTVFTFQGDKLTL